MSAILAPQAIVGAVGGAKADVATLTFVRMLGVAMFGIGAGALLGKKSSNVAGGRTAPSC